MFIRILGPVEIRHDGEALVPLRRRARALLGVLALRANTAVPAPWIVDALWGERPPPSAAVNLRSYASDLRRVLRSGAEQNGGARILSGRGAYTLVVGPQELDVLAFDALAAEGQRCLDAGEHELAVERLTRAAGLWRGSVLDGVPVPDAVRPTVERLDERRLDVVEGCVQARLELGQHGPVATELRALAGRHPLRERLWGQLMLALYRCGRPAEAVEAYQRLRRLLDAELGVEPGQHVTALYLRIVRADPTLVPATPGAVTGAPVPQQLPPDVTTFVGRGPHLRLLDKTVAADTGAAVVITAVSGTAGVGKTALAVHWAHRVRDRFPDGCLYVDLRGYGPEQPVRPASALGGFLRSLGMVNQPAELAELTARYRTLLAGRRMLVVLDNARSAEQVRPLLPGTAGCLVVVTSRDDLAGLVARDGARRVELDLMPASEAVDLLRGLVGARVDAEPDAAAALARCCAGLPLALRIAADLADRHPDRSLSDLVDDLTRRSLDALDAGDDPHTAVRAVFGWSHDTLHPAAARAFRLLALHPGRDLDVYSAAALIGDGVDGAQRLLDQLLRAHLVHRNGPGRYGMHDLLRAYATDVPSDRSDRDALTRLLDFYVHATAVAETRYPRGRGRKPPATTGPLPPLDDLARTTQWLDAERANLVAVAEYGARHGWPAHVCELSQALRPYLVGGAHHRDATTIHRHALDCARRTGDRHAEAAALNNLGGVDEHLGRYEEAVAGLRRALRIRQEIGDRHGEARTTNNLAIVHNRRGRYDEAADHFRRSMLISRELDDPASEAMALANLGSVHYRQARYADAIDCHRRALGIGRRLGDRELEGIEVSNLGMQFLRLGRHRDAVDHLLRALAISVEVGDRGGEGWLRGQLGSIHTRLGSYRVAREYVARSLAIHHEVGDRANEAAALVHRGHLLRRLGRHRDALRSHRLALDLDRELGDRFQETQALDGIAATFLAMHRPDRARTHYEAALDLARRAGHRYEEAGALDGLGHVYRRVGDTTAARAHWQQAFAVYTAIGVPDADRVRGHLPVEFDWSAFREMHSSAGSGQM